VAHYTRVSTEEQRQGWSVDDQLRTLRAHSEAVGDEVVAEIRLDEGYSGADPDRPGIRRAVELAEAGEIDVIKATKRDRFWRSRLHRLLMDQDLAEMDVRLEALNDTGHRIGDGVQDDFAEWEREEITRRTSTGRHEKARQGKVIAARLPDYGFKYNETRDGYEVVEEQMAVVRRIFAELASGASNNAVANALDREGVPTPSGGAKWQRTFVRQVAFDDAYRPHTIEELRALGVGEDVLSRLAEGFHGVWWYNTREARWVRVPDAAAPGGFRKSRRVREKPRSEWIAVPVPDAGVPREHVEEARRRMEHNERCSHAGRRAWELSGGVARCPGCGHALVAVTKRRRDREKPGEDPRYEYFYACTTRRRKGTAHCSYGRTPNAEKTEAEVWAAVRDAMREPERFRLGLDAYLDAREAEARERARQSEALAAKLVRAIRDAENARAKDQEMFRAGLMTLDELRASLERHGRAKGEAERELEAAEEGLREVRALRRDREAVLAAYEGFAADRLANLPREKRRALYNAFGVTAYPPKAKGEPLRVVIAALGESKGEERGCHADRTSTR
jgi:site-specific DNA recombinase